MLKATTRERRIIDPLLRCFDEKRPFIERFHKTLLDTISTAEALRPLVHSFRARLKDRDHLEDKLVRKLHESQKKGRKFQISEKNLLTKINDLAGIRILHLHTAQIEDIDKHLKLILGEFEYQIVEGPDARTWDDEYRKFFSDLGFATTSSESMYTSVHYVIGSSSKLKMTCELQVRTLMEEVWGEVDHALNYPHKSESVACREQIRALARATSTSTRLVDAIFTTRNDEIVRQAKREAPPRIKVVKKKALAG
jgi:ppGpp synthetase/RelA/SpoT-type nucleotidyltranferase